MNAVQMQMRAQLGLPFWDSRECSKATTLGWEYRLFTVFFGLIQWFTLEGSSGSPRFRHGEPLLERVSHDSSVFSTAPAPQTVTPRLRLLDARTWRTELCADSVSALQLPRHHGYLDLLAAIHRPPAKAQACRAGMHHLPRQKGTTPCCLEERGLRSQVDPLRPPSPHRPGPQQLHQLRLSR